MSSKANQFFRGVSLIAFAAMASAAAAQETPEQRTIDDTTGLETTDQVEEQTLQRLRRNRAQDLDDDGGQADPIIVTATKRAALLQDVPFSINAQTQEDIQRTGANTIEDIARNVAGLTVQNLGPGQSQVAVRGVSSGQIVRDQPGVKEQVGIYLDETVISLALFTPDIDLFDLDRVETLRGPQGTLFGSGSVGGTLRYITNQPDLFAFEGLGEADLNLVDGDDVGGSLKGVVNVPLVEGKVAMRAVGYYTQFGGFIDALRQDGSVDEDVNEGRRYGGRIAVTFAPTETITITPRVLYQEVEAGGFNRLEAFNFLANGLFADPFGGPGLDGPDQFLRLDEEFKDETLIADLVGTVELGAVELTSVTSYTDRSILVSRDASALTGSVSVDLGFPDEAVLLPSNLRDTTEFEMLTQEARLASIGESPFQWLVGAFYSDIQRNYAQRLPTPGYSTFVDAAFGEGTAAATSGPFSPDSPFNSDIPLSIEQYAFFGEASYEIGRLTATAGLRYFNFSETRDILFAGLFADFTDRENETTSSDGFTPRFILSYEASDDVTLNAQVARGFRLGGINDPLNLPLCTPEDRATFEPFEGAFGDETLWNYEIGVKAQRRAFRASAAAFYTDISDLQVTLDAGTCSSRIVFNVPEAHTLGVEFEVGLEPTPGFDISISGSFIEAEFDSSVTSGGQIVGGIREGNRLPSVPEYQISLTSTYFWNVSDAMNAFVSGALQFVGDRFTQPSDQEPGAGVFRPNLPFGGLSGDEVIQLNLNLPAYEILNLRAGLEFGRGFEVIGYVHNVFDTEALLSFDRERGGRARLGFHVIQPRTYGITVRKAF